MSPKDTGCIQFEFNDSVRTACAKHIECGLSTTVMRRLPHKMICLQFGPTKSAAWTNFSAQDAARRLRTRSMTSASPKMDALKALSKKNPKLVRSTEYTAPADPSIRLRSWKRNKFKYCDIPSPFPTLARGLFTQAASGQTKNRIVARGHDKFLIQERSLGQQ